jgi:hypothetical protein
MDEQPFRSVCSTAQALGVSHSTILSHLWEALGIKLFILRRILQELTTSSRQIRIELAEDYCPFSRLTRKNCQRLVTGDES